MKLVLQRSTIRPWRDTDREALVRHADNRNVARHLHDVFPHPYTDADAVEWLARCAAADPATNFAIEVDGGAAGGIGLRVGDGTLRRTAEIGYWLGEPFWGRGIMSEAVPAMTDWGFATLDLCRIQAGVFEGNAASMRVLEKAGYVCEARLRRSITKFGQTLDQLLYARIRED